MKNVLKLKKEILTVLCLLAIAPCFALFAGCGATVKVGAPVLTTNPTAAFDLVTWNAVSGADKYVISVRANPGTNAERTFEYPLSKETLSANAITLFTSQEPDFASIYTAAAAGTSFAVKVTAFKKKASAQSNEVSIVKDIEI
jgi:hypothetical protein